MILIHALNKRTQQLPLTWVRVPRHSLSAWTSGHCLDTGVRPVDSAKFATEKIADESLQLKTADRIANVRNRYDQYQDDASSGGSNRIKGARSS